MPTSRAVLAVIGKAAAVAAVLLIAPFFSIRTRAALIDPDIWWHIRVGNWIAQHRAVPHEVIFSQHADRPWIAYSWGFDFFVSGITRLFGLPGIPAALICLQVLLSLVLMLSILHLSRRFWPACCLSALTIYAYYTNPLRPVLLTSLFFMLELLLIFEAERSGKDRILFWMAPLFVLWANFHIQFIYGLFVLFLYAGARTVDVLVARWRSQSSMQRGTALPWLACIVATLACGIGPYGFLPIKVAFQLAGNTSQYALIQELQAMNFRMPEHYAQLVLVMLGFWVLGRSEKVKLFPLLLLAISAMVAFRSQRDSWFFCLAAGFIVADTIGSKDEHAVSVASPQLARNSVLYAAGVTIALIVAFALARNSGLDMEALSAPLNRIYPLAACDFIKNNKLPGPMFNNFNWGGFLIYDLPQQPVSIDGRVDAYGPELTLRAFETEAAHDWQNDPNLQRTNFVLLPQRMPLTAALAVSPGYRLVYQDGVAVVFVKTGPSPNPPSEPHTSR